MSEQKDFVNREKRFEVDEMVGFDAIVHRAGELESKFYSDLIDFSRTGMKLNVPFCARFNEVLILNMEFADEGYQYEGKCRVRHVRSLDENQWQIGCSIDPPLPLPLIEHLAKTTNQERRQYSRIEFEGEGELRRQGSSDTLPVQLTNMSKGGFCLSADTTFEVGEKIYLDAKSAGGEEYSFEAKVRWTREIELGSHIGCGFADSKSYHQMIECFDIPVDVGTKQILAPWETFNWGVLAAAFFALVLPSISFFVLGSSSDDTTKLAQQNSMTVVQQQTEPENIEANPAEPKSDEAAEPPQQVAKTDTMTEKQDGASGEKSPFESNLPESKSAQAGEIKTVASPIGNPPAPAAQAKMDPPPLATHQAATSRRRANFKTPIEFPGVKPGQLDASDFEPAVPWEVIKPGR